MFTCCFATDVYVTLQNTNPILRVLRPPPRGQKAPEHLGHGVPPALIRTPVRDDTPRHRAARERDRRRGKKWFRHTTHAIRHRESARNAQQTGLALKSAIALFVALGANVTASVPLPDVPLFGSVALGVEVKGDVSNTPSPWVDYAQLRKCHQKALE